MRTYEEYQRILMLWEEGQNHSDIARITGIPRATVRDAINRYQSLAGLEAQQERATLATPDATLHRIQTVPEVRKTYAYLLGLYLGDGNIILNANGRSYKLRITLDKKYPGIIESCVQAIQVILPNNVVRPFPKEGCFDVTCHYKHWPALFPQHGAGAKHLRSILLEPWQESIVDEYPLEFFRGLYHSDGARSRNEVNKKNYPRYLFSNMSEDILCLFTDTCDKLGLHWSLRQRTRTNCASIYISKRKDVEYLDSVIGPKA
ncbi:MAG: hypothetical protein OHK0046_37470 [Anaerolineae bacterium]